jgi:glycosyltransferase involved in cell wall biosynthesis
MPLAALQAMACGKPVISTRPLEIGCNAILYAPTSDDYQRHIGQLAANPAYARLLGDQGRFYVSQHHDWDRLTAEMEQILEYTARRSHD